MNERPRPPTGVRQHTTAAADRGGSEIDMTTAVAEPPKPATAAPHPAGPVAVCRVEDIAPGLARAFRVGDRSIAIFRRREGGLTAVDNKCPHKGGPLSEGMLAGELLVCPLHAFRFSPVDGSCDQPNVCPVTVHGCEAVDGVVHVRLATASGEDRA